MRLTIWNCRMALHERRKWEALQGLGPDLAVVSESATPGHAPLRKLLGATTSNAWVGPDQGRGLSVLSFGAYALEPLPRRPDELPDALATDVRGPGVAFTLVGVWARAPRYVQHLHDVLDAYEPLFRDREVVVAGDFNSNAIWDRFHGDRCHTRLVQRLSALGLESAYHWSRAEPHGAETEHTHALSGGGPRLHHVDYVFLPRAWMPRLRSCELGPPEPWLVLSDHVPMTVDLDGTGP